MFSSIFTAVFENKRVFPVKFMAVAGAPVAPRQFVVLWEDLIRES